MNTKSGIFTSGGTTSENSTYGVHSVIFCKIDFYFTEWTPKVVFSRVVESILHWKSQISSMLSYTTWYERLSWQKHETIVAVT